MPRKASPKKDQPVKIKDTPKNVAKALFGIKSDRTHTASSTKKAKA